MDKFRTLLKNISPITDKEFADTISYFKELVLKKNEFFVEHKLHLLAREL
jgi:hypothetical protein